METPRRADIETRIKQILASELDVAPSTLAATGPTTPLIGRGVGLDSMETLTLAAGIEAEFGICIDDEDLNVELFSSISSLSAFVLRALSNGDDSLKERV